MKVSHSAFIHQMNREILANPKIDKRHIIQFVNRKEYIKCLAQIKRLRPSLSKLASIQPLRMINAVCCSLRSSTKLKNYKHISYIEEDIKIDVHRLASRTVLVPWGVKQIKAPLIWKHTTGVRTKVGVIDTGVDFSHPDLRASVAGGVNLLHHGRPAMDDNGHGSHIIGTIAAASQGQWLSNRYDREFGHKREFGIVQGTGLGRGFHPYSFNNSFDGNSRTGSSARGLTGVAPQASIYAIKAFDKQGSAFVSDIVLGIEWCIRNQMDIINMSFGMKNRSPALRDAVKTAHDAGIIIVASSGNDGEATTVDYPARFVQAIAVGATNKKKRIASFSNRGKGISIYAPGDQIYSTWIHHGYRELSGTSMATSHVTGVIALLRSLNHKLTSKGVKALLKRTASPIKDKSKYIIGEINAQRAIRSYMK